MRLLSKTESSLATFQESEYIFHCLEFLKHFCYRGHKIKAIPAAGSRDRMHFAILGCARLFPNTLNSVMFDGRMRYNPQISITIGRVVI